MLKRLTATRPYLKSGNSRHRSGPCSHDLCQNVEVASGRLKQQNIRSDIERFMMKTAVAFFSCGRINYRNITTKIKLLKLKHGNEIIKIFPYKYCSIHLLYLLIDVHIYTYNIVNNYINK